MAPALSDSLLHVGVTPALAAYVGSSLVWQPGGPGGLPEIGAEFEGGFFAGVISHTADGVATHALVVAPAATGATGSGYTLTTEFAAKTSNTSTSGTESLFDGKANTDAMAAAGLASHPAANFCRGLSIGGKSDWYLPALRELEIAYINLKPTTNLSNTSSGANAYSVPPRASNYGASEIAQTAVLAFRSGAAESFPAGTLRHWTSTQISGTPGNNFQLLMQTGFIDASRPKSTIDLVRAFRRLPL